MTAAIVIYDGDCAFCSSAARFAQAKVAKNLKYQAYQLSDLVSLNLTEAECQRALQMIIDDKKFSAEKAVIELLRYGNLFYRSLAMILSLPILRLLTRIGYRLIAKYRHRLPGGTPTCRM